jgi:hypothetical protein
MPTPIAPSMAPRKPSPWSPWLAYQFDCLALEHFRKQPSFRWDAIPPIATSYLSELNVMLVEGQRVGRNKKANPKIGLFV